LIYARGINSSPNCSDNTHFYITIDSYLLTTTCALNTEFSIGGIYYTKLSIAVVIHRLALISRTSPVQQLSELRHSTQPVQTQLLLKVIVSLVLTCVGNGYMTWSDCYFFVVKTIIYKMFSVPARVVPPPTTLAMTN
jgi:hypothetical protein